MICDFCCGAKHCRRLLQILPSGSVKFKIEKKSFDETVKNVSQNLTVKTAGEEILVNHERAERERKNVSDRP